VQRSASTAKATRRRSRSAFHIPAWEFRHTHYGSRAERPGCDLVQVAASCWSGYARARLVSRLLGLVVVALGLALVGQTAARSRAALRRNVQDPTTGRHPDEPGSRSTEDHWLPPGSGSLAEPFVRCCLPRPLQIRRRSIARSMACERDDTPSFW
jgi:hypothetical protein